MVGCCFVCCFALSGYDGFVFGCSLVGFGGWLGLIFVVVFVCCCICWLGKLLVSRLCVGCCVVFVFAGVLVVVGLVGLVCLRYDVFCWCSFLCWRCFCFFFVCFLLWFVVLFGVVFCSVFGLLVFLWGWCGSGLLAVGWLRFLLVGCLLYFLVICVVVLCLLFRRGVCWLVGGVLVVGFFWWI